jgi:SAM-dependent methyltransferase
VNAELQPNGVNEKIALLEQQIADIKRLSAPSLPAAPAIIKLDLGCGNEVRRKATGKTREEGWLGVDIENGPGVDVACDLGKDKWPWPDNSVDEVHCSHMLEHVPAKARIHFFNELYRVMKPGAKGAIITPHWASHRAYGDVTHEWPPVSEMFWQYLNREWLKENAPHVGFNCHFEVTYGYSPADWLVRDTQNRNPEYAQKTMQEAFTKYKEACQDMHATLTKR